MATGQQVKGLRGAVVQQGKVYVVTGVFEDEGKPYLNLSGIRDAFLSDQFNEVSKEPAVLA